MAISRSSTTRVLLRVGAQLIAPTKVAPSNTKLFTTGFVKPGTSTKSNTSLVEYFIWRSILNEYFIWPLEYQIQRISGVCDHLFYTKESSSLFNASSENMSIMLPPIHWFGTGLTTSTETQDSCDPYRYFIKMSESFCDLVLLLKKTWENQTSTNIYTNYITINHYEPPINHGNR